MMPDVHATGLPKRKSALENQEAIIARASVPAPDLIVLGQNKGSTTDFQFSPHREIGRNVRHEFELQISPSLGSAMEPKFTVIDLRILDGRRTTRVMKATSLEGASDELVIIERNSLVLEDFVFVAHISNPIVNKSRTLDQTRSGTTLAIVLSV